MKNKKLAVCLILVLILQLLVPVGMIAFSTTSEKDLEKNGTVYKMEIRIDAVFEGILYYEFTDENYSKFLSENYYGYYDYYDYSDPHESIYLIMGTDAYGTGRFADCVLERPGDDLPFMRIDAEAFEKLSSYDISKPSLNYTPPRQIYVTEATAHLYTEEALQNSDPVAEQKWYLHLLVYKGRFQVEGITDEYGNPVETRLPELVAKMS